jgi:helix-turn-helix protein
MSESVIADFVAKFNSDRLNRTEPIKGRVLLSDKRLVLAINDNNKLTIPLEAIVDIAVGHVPEELDGFFESTVTIAFERNNYQFVAAVEGDDETIEKFSNLLFKALVNGEDVTIKHPARIGGRVTDQEFQPGKLILKPKLVTINRQDDTIEVNLSEVIQFTREDQKIANAERPVLQVRHMPEGRSMMTILAMDSYKKMGILARYLQLELSDLLNEIADIDLSDDKKEILVALYSGAGGEGISLPNIVDEDPSRVTMMLNQLEEDELIIPTEEGTKLTPKGQVLVNKHMESVNA